MRLETSLYRPVKRFLEARGFEVKGEVCGCDVVAVHRSGAPLVVIGELKLAFNLELVLQGVDRVAVSDEVWLAVRMSARRGREHDPRVRKLCRLLGFGLLRLFARPGGNPRGVRPLAAATGPETPLDLGRGASPPPRRSGARRQHARTDHDRLPTGGAFMRGGASGRRADDARAPPIHS